MLPVNLIGKWCSENFALTAASVQDELVKAAVGGQLEQPKEDVP
jgi:hypothetical protein